MSKPLAVFYAGTNGSGKSTLRDNNPVPGVKVIDPDAIARTICPSDPRSVDVLAGREAIRQFREVIAQRQNFSMETTLTGRSAVDRMEKAKSAGFEVHLYYVGLSTVELNIARVAMRVANGGHHIDEADIRRRYTESLENLPRAMELADSGRIYSNEDDGLETQYVFSNGVLSRRARHPVQWAQDAVKAQSRHSLSPSPDETIVEAAEAVQSEQQAMLTGASLQQTYEATLANYVEAKHNQVARLEGRLKNLIEQQDARVRQLENSAPGKFSLPGTKRAWQVKVAHEQARQRTLRNRLEAVREIREGTGLRTPRINELATRRMRAENPELASSWDAMREAQRKQEEEERKQWAEERIRKKEERRQEQNHSRGRTLRPPR